MATRDSLKHVVSTSEPNDTTLGDEYYDPSSNKLFKRLAVNGTSVQWVEQQQSIGFQASGITATSAPRFVNFPGGILSFNASTGVLDIISGTTGTVTSVSGTGTVSGLTLSGTVTSSGNLTLGGTLSLTSLNVTTALGFTPIQLSSAITGYTAGANTALAATDTVLAAFGKLQGQVTARGVGTVTSVSVTSANGFAGTVATSTTTPAITISTSITGLLKGNGTAISAAVAGTDYQTAQSVTGIVKSSGTTRSAATAGTDYLAPPTGTALLKANSGGALANAVAGTDYQTAQSVTGIVKSSGTTRSAAVAGTDYQAPIGTISGIAKGNGANALTAAVAGTDFVAPSGTFFIGTTSIAHNRASATLSMTGVNIDGSAGSAGVASTVTTTASTTNSAFKIPLLNTTGVATGNFGLLLDSAGASDFTYNPSTNTLAVGVAEVTSPTPATVNAIRARSNIAWQSPSATSTITSKMLDAGTLSFEGSVGQLFSITNSMTGTIFSVNDISGIPSIEVLDTGLVKIAQYAGFVAYGVSPALNSGAGTTQGTALLLTRPINNVTTVAASTGVILPAATPGMRIIVRNGGSNSLNIYPASGAQINTLGTNAAFVHTVSTVLEFVAFSTTQWYTLNSTYA